MNSLRHIFYNLEKPSTKWSGYFEVYERHLSKYRGLTPRILEIGILDGGSIDLWMKYFGPGTTITAIDIDPKCANYNYDFPVEIVIGDQGDPEFWDSFWKDREAYNVIIDDGGHQMQQQITSLQKCFSHLREDGVYITEDVHTSYWNRWGGMFRAHDTFLEYSKRLIDYMNRQHINKGLLNNTEMAIFEDLHSVYFYNSQVAFEKKKYQDIVIEDNKQNEQKT